MASEKMCKLDDHVAVAVAGINSDANLLINAARLEILDERYIFN